MWLTITTVTGRFGVAAAPFLHDLLDRDLLVAQNAGQLRQHGRGGRGR